MPIRPNCQLGKIFDVWWKVTKIDTWKTNYRVTLVNQANGMTVSVQGGVFNKVIDGEQSISQTIAHKLNPRKNDCNLYRFKRKPHKTLG